MTPGRIVHLTTFLQGGAGRAITELACAQHRAGYDVVLMTSATGEPGYGNYPEYLDRLAAADVNLILEDSLFKRDERLNQQALDRLLGVRSPDEIDVLHAHAAVPAAIALRFAAGSRNRRPVVVQTQHGWGTTKTSEQAAHDLIILSAVDRVITTSHATSDFLVRSGIPLNQVIVIPCGIDAAAVPASDEALAYVGRVRGMTPPETPFRFVVGCVGSVTDNKNQLLLVRAIAHHTARHVHAVFIGEDGERLTSVARDLGVADRVHVAGYQSAADRWIGLFDALAVPSRSEGQGLVVLEAFRAATPVLASDIPALREMVVDGETGWLFESDNVTALAKALGRARSASVGERRLVVENAARCFRVRYTRDAMIAQHERLYSAMTAAPIVRRGCA